MKSPTHRARIVHSAPNHKQFLAYPELLAGTATNVREKARKESRDFPSTAMVTMVMTPESRSHCTFTNSFSNHGLI